jgi:uncharacterized protein YjiS (DUF1127 family)
MHTLFVTLPRLPRLHLLAFLLNARALRHQRRQLARLDASQLADIGLTADQAMAEAHRPIWDAPPHWRL